MLTSEPHCLVFFLFCIIELHSITCSTKGGGWVAKWLKLDLPFFPSSSRISIFSPVVAVVTFITDENEIEFFFYILIKRWEQNVVCVCVWAWFFKSLIFFYYVEMVPEALLSFAWEASSAMLILVIIFFPYFSPQSSWRLPFFLLKKEKKTLLDMMFAHPLVVWLCRLSCSSGGEHDSTTATAAADNRLERHGMLSIHSSIETNNRRRLFLPRRRRLTNWHFSSSSFSSYLNNRATTGGTQGHYRVFRRSLDWRRLQHRATVVLAAVLRRLRRLGLLPARHHRRVLPMVATITNIQNHSSAVPIFSIISSWRRYHRVQTLLQRLRLLATAIHGPLVSRRISPLTNWLSVKHLSSWYSSLLHLLCTTYLKYS